MDTERLSAGAEVRRGPEGVRADEHGFLRPPEGYFAPAEPVDGPKHLEWRPGHALEGHAEERHAETRGQKGAVPIVPVEQLDDTCGLAERVHPLLHALRVHGINKPDARARKQRV
jgi:hypothetical protein